MPLPALKEAEWVWVGCGLQVASCPCSSRCPSHSPGAPCGAAGVLGAGAQLPGAHVTWQFIQETLARRKNDEAFITRAAASFSNKCLRFTCEGMCLAEEGYRRSEQENKVQGDFFHPPLMMLKL